MTDNVTQMRSYDFEALTVDARGVVVERKSGNAQVAVDLLGHGIELEVVAVPAGSYQMGSPRSQGFPDECPQHRVALPAFWIGRYPITQEQWKAVMGKELRWRFPGGPRRPAERVSWEAAVEFCEHLSKKTRHAYALPSEAQWECACRAGTFSAFHCGKTITTDLANYNGLHTYLDEPQGVYRHVTTDVGSFAPNAFGLYDMHGNVWEWCADAWHDDYVGAPSDGRSWLVGGDSSFRVARGGSWHENPGVCRSAVRLRFAPGEGEDYLGLRVVRLAV